MERPHGAAHGFRGSGSNVVGERRRPGDGDPGAATGRVADVDGSSVRLRQAPDDVEPEPRAATGSALPELREDPAPQVGSDALALVVDDHDDPRLGGGVVVRADRAHPYRDLALSVPYAV